MVPKTVAVIPGDDAAPEANLRPVQRRPDFGTTESFADALIERLRP